MKKGTRPFIVILAAFCLAAPSASVMGAAERPLASPKLVQALVDEVSGESAFDATARISRFDRVQASDGFHAAAAMIKDELERMGYSDAAVEGWPSNGTLRYSTCRSVIGWRAKSGELWLVSPGRERLCSYREVPLTLVKHSGSGHAEAELVDVGTGLGEDAYSEKEVRGRIVLATGPSGQVMREAVIQRGALGVVTWYSPETRPGYPNMIRYTAIWPRWEERDKLGFGFNVSKLQGWRLKQMLEEGKRVVLKADVEAEFSESRIEVVTASFPGSEDPAREVLIIGHLCHPAPSANDNASGSGGMLEMARALRAMVDKGLVPAPRRTIRFLWVPEFNGTLPYVLAHLERTRNTIAAINCDMIGEDFHKTSGYLQVFSHPWSRPSFLADVVGDFARLAAGLSLKSLTGSDHPFVFEVLPYSGGSDHVVFNDGSLAVPSVMLNRGDTFHHTNLDSMDKVDPTELRRSCFIALGAALFIASANDAEAGAAARLVARHGPDRLAGDYRDACAALLDAGSAETLLAAYGQTLNVIERATDREIRAVLSAAILAGPGRSLPSLFPLTKPLEALAGAYRAEARGVYEGRCRELGVKPGAPSLSAEDQAASRVVPVRDEKFIGPLDPDYLSEKIGEEAVKGIQLQGDAAYEALNFADGRRSLLEIARAVSAEIQPVSVSAVKGFFELLEKAGLVSLKGH
ncbi:MAG: DUF4910 domain-containing protein [Candidatus Aminicenantes bacterium]|nr:DUF4910 domain-containing protein [Candidatus Aminicenantes bacterium]